MAINRHDVFISYNWNKDDKQAAIEIERRLRRFHWLFPGQRPISVYRDETSTGARSELGSALEEKIQHAGMFLLICSETSVQNSRWIPREVEFWLRSRRDPLSQTVFATVRAEFLSSEILPEPMQGEISRSGTAVRDYLVLPLTSAKRNLVSARWEQRLRRRKAVCQLAAEIWNESPEKTCRADLRNKVILIVAVLAVAVALIATLVTLQVNRSEVDQQLKALLAENFDQDRADFTDSRFVDFGALKNSFAEATFDRSQIVQTNFAGNQLREARFHDATLSDVRFEAVSAVDASFSCPEGDLAVGCKATHLQDVVFARESKLIDVNFNRVRFERVTFDGVDLHDSTFIGATGSEVVFRNVDLKGVNMTKASIDGLSFERVCYDDETSWPEGMVGPKPPSIRLACRLGG